MFSSNFDPEVCRSRLSAMRASDYYLQDGHEVFMFENRETGRAFVVTREMGVDEYLNWDGARMVSYTSPRLYGRGDCDWHEPGRA